MNRWKLITIGIVTVLTTSLVTGVAAAGAGPAGRSLAAGPAAGCETTGDRVWRIAKPGLVGTLLGAGAGAAGGAIADGGKAAGKGAMIGGLAGAVLGSAWGVYQTKNECGTIWNGSNRGFSAPPTSGGRPGAYRPAPPAAPGDRITVFEAR